jgi:hypothetical protein
MIRAQAKSDGENGSKQLGLRTLTSQPHPWHGSARSMRARYATCTSSRTASPRSSIQSRAVFTMTKREQRPVPSNVTVQTLSKSPSSL